MPCQRSTWTGRAESRIRRVVQKSTTCEAEMKGPLRFRTMPLRFLVDLGISTDFLRVEFLMLQKLFALFFGNPRSWNFSYRAQPQHHRVPWFSWNFLVPKALSKKGTPRHSPQNFFTTLFPKVAIGDYAASHFGTMSMEAWMCKKSKISGVSSLVSSVLGIGWECRSLDGAAEDRESSGWGLDPGVFPPLALDGVQPHLRVGSTCGGTSGGACGSQLCGPNLGWGAPTSFQGV